MKKINFLVFVLLIPAMVFGQWQQMGAAVVGTAENDKLGSVHAIDIDSAGTTIVYGTAFNSNNFPFSGYAKVMDWNGTSWIQRGNTFEGTDSTLEGTGSAVSISADGNTVAISSPWGYNNLGYKCGNVRVFDWNGTAWVIRGSIIHGEGNQFPALSGDVFGTALELSADGNHLIVGAKSNTKQEFVLQFQGHARVYNWDGTAWAQVGPDLDGDTFGGVQEFGYAVSINDNGNRIAVGARSYNTDAQGGGVVCMYEFNGTTWVQIGDTIKGTTVGEKVGSSVQLTRDGNSVAIGSPGTNGINVGAVRIFDWNGTNWVPRGMPLNAVGNSAMGQSIDLSADGKILAVGEPWKNSLNGAVRLFQWNGTSWQQLGNMITPAGPSNTINSFGSAVRINAIGSRVVVGETGFDGSASNIGRISVHQNVNVLAIDEIDKANISLYPNPSSGLFQVIAEEPISNLIVYDMMGKEITKINPFSNWLNVDISDQPVGRYTVKIQLNSGVKVVSVMKSN